jgi:hypothetical protein
MKEVICVNDKNLPQGAAVTEGCEYEIEMEYLNALDQKVYILKGVPNEGTTKWGMKWVGYNAVRFSKLDSLEVEEKECNFQLN